MSLRGRTALIIAGAGMNLSTYGIGVWGDSVLLSSGSFVGPALAALSGPDPDEDGPGGGDPDPGESGGPARQGPAPPRRGARMRADRPAPEQESAPEEGNRP